MDRELIHISFEGGDATQAADYAQELTEYLREVAPEVEVCRVRDDTQAMDFGSSLVLIFAGTAGPGLVYYLRYKFNKDLLEKKKEIVEAELECEKLKKEAVEAELEYEKLKREPLKKLKLRTNGVVKVVYASPEMVSAFEHLRKKVRE